MIVVHTVAALRSALAPFRLRQNTIGFVPTMGALHQGHLALLHQAAAENDATVLSVFVNPTQFDDPADLAAYPRTAALDQALAESAGVAVYFAPPPAEVYPPAFSATVALAGPIVDNYEGAHRGAQHFHGVTTVVTKLLMMVQPDRGYFGQKDAQQLRVVRALVDDLNIDVQIVAVPTVREPDGLALSSRNIRLTADDRASALGLSRALFNGRNNFDRGTRLSSSILADSNRLLREHSLAVEYLGVVDGDSFEPVELIGSAGAVLIVAATAGRTRLIDNVILDEAVIPGQGTTLRPVAAHTATKEG